MAKDIDLLMNLARVHLAGAVEDAMRLELFMVFDEFFRRSTAWRERIVVDILPQVTQYELTPFSGQIVGLVRVWDGELPVRSGVTMPAQGILQLRHGLTTTAQWQPEVYLTVVSPVTRDGNPVVPPAIYAEHMDTLVEGLIGRMMSQPNKPYSNTSLAQYHLQKFRSGTSRAKNATFNEGLLGAQRFLFPQTFNRRK